MPTPLPVESRTPLVASTRRAQIALLQAAIKLSSGQPGSTLAPGLRRYALWLEHAAFVDGTQDDSLFEVAASLYEFAANLTDIESTSIFRPPLSDLIRSAIVASQTSFQGRASIIAQRAGDFLNRQRPRSDVERCHLEVARIVVALLGRRFHFAFRRSRYLEEYKFRAAEELHRTDAPQHEHDALNLAVMIAHASADCATGMLAGVPLLRRASIQALQTLRAMADENDDANRYWLSDRLFETVSRMNATSMHGSLGFRGSPVPLRFREKLAREGYLELWGPQLEAIRQGITDSSSDSNWVISIPTGSGKTLLAELLILATLSGNNGWAIYIAPSRALVNQVSQDLKGHLQPCGVKVQTILAGAEQSLVMDQELEFLPQARSVVVTTPEKLDTYYRNAPEIFDTCRLLIVDEAHKINEPQRGSLIESIVARFVLLEPQARIALLSGVMSNSEEMATWLDEAMTQVVVSRRRPTRHLYGVAVRQNEPLSFGIERQKRDKYTTQLKRVRRVGFKGG